MNIVAEVDKTVLAKRSVYPQHRNWASTIGHPCMRFLVYSRLNWQDKALPELGLAYIFREGNHHESDLVRLLQDSGVVVQESQRSFYYEPAEISGKIDGIVKDGEKKYPLEIKSMAAWTWESINFVEDLRNHDAHYVRGYFDQMQVYLFVNEMDEGILLLKNKQTGRLKQINVTLDYAYTEALLKKCEEVNRCVKAKEYPERITDRAVCKGCAFKSICLPDEESAGLNVSSDPDLIRLLEERDKLEPAAKAFEKIHDKIKVDYLERMDAGDYLVGDFSVKLKRQDRTFYAIPDEVKKQYEQTKPVLISKIKKITGDE